MRTNKPALTSKNMDLGLPLYFNENTILFGISPIINFYGFDFFDLPASKYLAQHGVSRIPVHLVGQNLRSLVLSELVRVSEEVRIYTDYIYGLIQTEKE